MRTILLIAVISGACNLGKKEGEACKSITECARGLTCAAKNQTEGYCTPTCGHDQSVCPAGTTCVQEADYQYTKGMYCRRN